MGLLTHLGSTGRARLSLGAPPVFPHLQHPGAPEGPYRSQSSNPAVRRQATPSERRYEPHGSTPSGSFAAASSARAAAVPTPHVSPLVTLGGRLAAGLSPVLASLMPSLAGLNPALASTAAPGAGVLPGLPKAAAAASRRVGLIGAYTGALGHLTGPQRALAPYDIAAAEKYGIPASVLLAQQGQESNYGTNTGPSSAGAFGVSQFIPSTAKQYGVMPGSSRAAIRSQVMGQAHLLSDKHFMQDPQGALSAYSGGYAAGAYNNPILQNAHNFAILDRGRVQRGAHLAGAVGGMPVPMAYANPLPAGAWSPGRSDQGFDASPKTANAPILAVSRGRVIALGAPGWPEGGGVTYRILKGPQKGKEVYNFEGLNPVAGLKPGDVVHRGQVIARGRPGGSIEIGYYQGNPTTSGGPLNNQVLGSGQTYSVASTDGMPTVGSRQFERQILGQAVDVPGSGYGAPVVAGTGAGSAALSALTASGAPGSVVGAAAQLQNQRGAIPLVQLTPPNAAGPLLPGGYKESPSGGGPVPKDAGVEALLALLAQAYSGKSGLVPLTRPRR